MQKKVKKGTSTHIKEIQALQKYFETVYRHDDLSRTVCGAAVTLKETFIKKMEFLKSPSYVKLEQWYKTAFNMYPPKFPRLPSSEFGVTFSSPFPDWFVCGDFVKILRQESHKKANRVVLTKYNLDSFKGHLHIGI